MRIIYLSHYFPPEGNAPATRVHAMCKRWVASGHDVCVVTCAPNVPSGKVYDGYRNAWCAEEDIDGIRVIRIWTFIAPNKGTLLRILNYVSYVPFAVWRTLRLGPADVIVATSPQFFCGWAGVFAARLKRTKFVLEIRDIWPESIQAVQAINASGNLGARIALYSLTWLEKWMYKLADTIVTVGAGYEQKLHHRGVPENKIHVIPNGVDLEQFKLDGADRSKRQQAGAEEGEFLVGYIGTVGLAHGLKTVVDAAQLAADQEFTNLKFVIVGAGAKLDEIQQSIAKSKLKNIVAVGRRPKEEIADWLASVDACLIHLKDEPLFETVIPSKMFEAAAMKKPILIGVRGQAKEILAAADGGLSFEPENPIALLNAVRKMSLLPDKGESFGESSRRYVEEFYNYDLLADRYESLLVRMSGG